MSIQFVHKNIIFSYQQPQLPDYDCLIRIASERYGPLLNSNRTFSCHHVHNDPTQLYAIKNDQDYQQVLKVGKHLVVNLDQNSNINAPKIVNTEEIVGDLLKKYNVKGDTKTLDGKTKNWNKKDWLEFIKNGVEEIYQQKFKDEIFSKFETKNNTKLNFNATLVNQDVIKQIDDQQAKVSRYYHSEDPVFSFFMGHYQRQLNKRPDVPPQAKKNCEKIHSWRQKNTVINKNNSSSDMIQSYNHERVLPALNIVRQNNNEKVSQNSLLFPTTSLTESEKSQQYFLFDKIYTALVVHTNAPPPVKQIAEIIQEQFKSYTDTDTNFIKEIFQSYVKYSEGGDKYLAPTLDNYGILPEFEDNEVVGLLGDWGTGIRDSYDLLDELVINKKATIILHGGDVYYSGLPNEFQKVVDKITQLRKQYPNLRYYAIPGNHDYYTYGGPYLNHLRQLNQPNYLQKFSFFCLRNKSHTVQYLGLDTGKNDHNFTSGYNPLFDGTYIQKKECEWAIRRINQFKGKTILLTHHPVFSCFQQVIGHLTKFGIENEQINYKISQQLFEVLPKLSCWYWGHEHRFAQYADNAYGIPKCRLLGNSAFQNNQDNLYDVNFKAKPIVNTETFPGKTSDGFFNHNAAVFRNHLSPALDVLYVQMTASYDQPSTKVKQFGQSIVRPTKREISLNKIYRIKEQSGLSISVKNSSVLIDYDPSDFIFQKADNPKFNGVLTSDSDYLIEVAGTSSYLYYTSWGTVSRGDYVKQSSSEKEKYKWRFQLDKLNLQTGDTFYLYSTHRKSKIGRQFYVQNFGLTAAATGSKFQIYSLDTDNTGQPPQAEPIVEPPKNSGFCCETM